MPDTEWLSNLQELVSRSASINAYAHGSPEASIIHSSLEILHDALQGVATPAMRGRYDQYEDNMMIYINELIYKATQNSLLSLHEATKALLVHHNYQKVWAVVAGEHMPGNWFSC